MDATFREATAADVDRICEVNRAAIGTLATEPYDERQLSAWKAAVEPELYPIEDDETCFLVAETNTDIVGFGWMKPTADEYFTADVNGEITGMYVHPDATGQGVGTRLYDELERFARNAAVDSLGLWASLNAVRFYRKHGYETVTEQTVEYDGTDVPVEEMRKELSE